MWMKLTATGSDSHEEKSSTHQLPEMLKRTYQVKKIDAKFEFKMGNFLFTLS